ncbi:Eukaryotic rRNA processing protein EBP2 family protein [Brugia pahangi]
MSNAKRGEMSTTDVDVNARILPAIESEEESSDSDRELQIAFDEGLLKTDKLNYIVEKKRPIINKKAELEDKIKKLAMNLAWLETLDVEVNNDHLNEKVLSDDFEREIIFYKQAEKAAQIAISRLREMGVRIFRPTDYYAEMVKSDQHMQKIRQRMAEIEESKQKLEAIRRIREEKKFAAKVQKKVIERKQSEKKILAEAVKKHRKGVKSHLDAMLNNTRRIQDTEVGIKRSEKGRMREKRFRRIARDKKFGFGGQKKRSKKNNKNSFEEFATPGSLARRLKGHHFGAHVLKSHAKARKR